MIRFLVATFLLLFSTAAFSQEVAPVQWNVTSKRIADRQFELHFTTTGAAGWQIYAPNQSLFEVPTTELRFDDPSVAITGDFIDSGNVKIFNSELFEQEVRVYDSLTTWVQLLTINGDIPANLRGSFLFTYGNEDEFYPSTPFEFSIPLEGGMVSTVRIKIPTIDMRNPVAPCGDDDTENKGLWVIFGLGFFGGLIALVTPCVFPLIPLTVSFFTKRARSRKKGIANALLYGFCIVLIYALLSIPFYIFDTTNPEILNNISTSVTLNIIFFVVFIVFALSFFGLFEIGLPSSFANKADSKAGMSDLGGIFFMALTLAIVSFSCTGPILGSLLAGALTKDGGAVQLTAGMTGFGVGLGLPFALFALFPGWLQSMPRSGSWLNSIKVVLGFLELALAIKFLSNADLVKQWGLLKREVFIGLWIVISLFIVLYLLGLIKFYKEAKPQKFSPIRWFFIIFFSLSTLYLLPGVTNTRYANLSLISGFPPPLCYSIYQHPINCERNIEPMRDYEEALLLARQQNKPLLIDFTGWACVNCRRMEENVWTDPDVHRLMQEEFIVVSLYVDERKRLPPSEQIEFITKTGDKKNIVTVGDKWSTFQFENFNSVSQPQYAIISPEEIALTKTKGYTGDAVEFADWLRCGIEAFQRTRQQQ